MEIILRAEPKEIAALVLEIQEQRKDDSKEPIQSEEIYKKIGISQTFA